MRLAGSPCTHRSPSTSARALDAGAPRLTNRRQHFTHAHRPPNENSVGEVQVLEQFPHVAAAASIEQPFAGHLRTALRPRIESNRPVACGEFANLRLPDLAWHGPARDEHDRPARTLRAVVEPDAIARREEAVGAERRCLRMRTTGRRLGEAREAVNSSKASRGEDLHDETEGKV